MTNKMLGLSILVALVGALAVPTPPLYRTLLSNENNIVYAQERQQLQTGGSRRSYETFLRGGLVAKSERPRF